MNSLGSVVHQLLSWWKDSPDDPRKYQPPVIAASRATIRMLKDRNDDIKAEALRALLVIHLSFLNAPPASRPVQEPILAEVPPDELRAAPITALKCQNPEVRRLAAEVLERLGPLLSSDIPPELSTAWRTMLKRSGNERPGPVTATSKGSSRWCPISSPGWSVAATLPLCPLVLSRIWYGRSVARTFPARTAQEPQPGGPVRCRRPPGQYRSQGCRRHSRAACSSSRSFRAGSGEPPPLQ